MSFEDAQRLAEAAEAAGWTVVRYVREAAGGWGVRARRRGRDGNVVEKRMRTCKDIPGWKKPLL